MTLLPGHVDYLLRDDFISQTSRKAYGVADLPDFLTGKKEVEATAEVADRLYVVGYPYDNTSVGRCMLIQGSPRVDRDWMQRWRPEFAERLSNLLSISTCAATPRRWSR